MHDAPRLREGEINNICGAADTLGRLSVPDGEQDVAPKHDLHASFEKAPLVVAGASQVQNLGPGKQIEIRASVSSFELGRCSRPSGTTARTEIPRSSATLAKTWSDPTARDDSA